MADAAKISPQYVDLVSLVARQVMGAIDITVLGQSGNTTDATDVKAFMKDIGFSQCVQFRWEYLAPLTNESQAGQSCGAFVCCVPRIPVLERIPRRSVARTPSGSSRCHFRTPVCSPGYRFVVCISDGSLVRFPSRRATGISYPNATGTHGPHPQGIERESQAFITEAGKLTASGSYRVWQHVDHDVCTCEGVWGWDATG